MNRVGYREVEDLMAALAVQAVCAETELQRRDAARWLGIWWSALEEWRGEDSGR